ncbi:hypothetical protein LJR027_001607 [Terrabacter sp. LjRoot27]|uniref:hypothetical protein n=1 Tax=Terrabacter sp. LjRoot27 TaxID=3342306 RepID=UPI003ECE000A
MAFSRAVVLGTLVGAAAATGIYVAVASPSTPPRPAAAPLAAGPEGADVRQDQARPVPTFTTLVPAPCPKGAVLEHDVCVTHVAGPPRTLPTSTVVPVPSGTRVDGPTATSPSATPSRALATGDDPAADEDAEDHRDGDDDGDDDHGDEEHEQRDDGAVSPVG